MRNRNRPTCGQIEQRDAPFADAAPTVDGRRLRGLIPYGVESRDLGGWREVIDAGALRNADLSELVATVDHSGMPLGRHPNTLHVEDGPNAFAWSVELPESRADVREAVERGDVVGGSWRMVVAPGGDRWVGDVRHVHRIAALHDVTVAGSRQPAYPTASVEYRTEPEPSEPRPAPRRNPAGSLRVEERSGGQAPLDLAGELRAAGFPGERAVVDFRRELFEDRAVTWSGSLDAMNRPLQPSAAPLGYDQRWIWPSVRTIPVDAGVTSVDVPTQTARSLAAASLVVRTLAATTAKPETGSTLTMVNTALKQVATKQSGIPSIYLEQPAFDTVIQEDLRLAINDGLDKLVLDAIATSGFQAPGSDPLLTSIRKSITTLWAAGYAPDTLWLTPTAAETLDLLTSSTQSPSAGTPADYVFSPADFAPPSIFRLARRISKSIPAPVVVDSAALGKLYASAVSLARFEENDGGTNTSLVRLELSAVFGVERTAAAVRIAAS